MAESGFQLGRIVAGGAGACDLLRVTQRRIVVEPTNPGNLQRRRIEEFLARGAFLSRTLFVSFQAVFVQPSYVKIEDLRIKLSAGDQTDSIALGKKIVSCLTSSTVLSTSSC